ncbi:MAG TPA: hypothetical protein IAA77_01680 [Candidatus Avibacteroides excrementipullorum]|nr:hypothetical protein [Candidatus Avibacteroides excrementipullorum]
MYAIFADDRLDHRPGCAPSTAGIEPIPKQDFRSRIFTHIQALSSGPKAREKREKVNSFNAIEEFSDFHMKI